MTGIYHNPSMAPIRPDQFVWASGIEDTFIPQSRPGLRALDEYALTQHYQLWQSDFELLAASGVKAVRWGIPWYRVEPYPGQYDWAWVDQVLDRLVNRHEILPILDLMHYGTPLWLENSFLNASYPQRVAEYAARVAERYRGLVRCYTPLNEPMVNAEFCGLRGEWPPYLVGEDGRVRLTLALARGIVLTTRAIKDVQPDCQTVQVEALWTTWTQDESLAAICAERDMRQFLSFDLCTGRVDGNHPLAGYLIEHGGSEHDLAWFADQAVRFDIFGANFYPWCYNELYRRADGRVAQRRGLVAGCELAEAARRAWQHSGLPVMITETSAKGPVSERARWMDETIAAVHGLRAEGVPLVGYTWFPLLTMIDWAYRTGRKPVKDYLLHLGLYESAFDEQGVLRRQPTDLVEHFRRHQQVAMPALLSEAIG